MKVTICVLLWVKSGQEELFVEYENCALGIASAHGAVILSRVRRNELSNFPYEVQVLQFPSQDEFQKFMEDPARPELGPMRDEAIAMTEVIRVDEIS